MAEPRWVKVFRGYSRNLMRELVNGGDKTGQVAAQVVSAIASFIMGSGNTFGKYNETSEFRQPGLKVVYAIMTADPQGSPLCLTKVPLVISNAAACTNGGNSRAAPQHR
jgi:hypothetical protein